MFSSTIIGLTAQRNGKALADAHGGAKSALRYLEVGVVAAGAPTRLGELRERVPSVLRLRV